LGLKDETANLGEQNMNLKKTKIFAIVTLTFLILSMIPFVNMPLAEAANIKTYAFIAVSPNRISLGESTVVNIWLQPIPPSQYYVFHGLSVTVTKPDGTTETLGPYTTYTIGSAYFNYLPTMLGNYSFKLNYPGESFANGTVTYLPSETPQNTALSVQQDPLPVGRPENSLPTEYWTNPINARNRSWSSIAGNWLIRGYNTSYSMSNSDAGKGFNPYSLAPRTSHIMYTKELALGGLIGGDYGSDSFYAGLTYEAKLTPPIIMDGKMYYRTYPSDFGYYQGVAGSYPGAVCVDLRTGEELWRNDKVNLDAGQIYDYVSGNQMGGIPYLWDFGSWGAFAFFAMGPSLMFRPTTWHMYDGNTGNLIANFTGALASSFIQTPAVVYGADGTMYAYFLSGAGGWLAMWNSTKALESASIVSNTMGTNIGFLRNIPGTYNWSKGIQWNVTVPVHMVMDSTGALFQSANGVTGNVLIAAVESRAISYKEIGYSLTTGQQLWVHDLDPDHYTAARAFGEGKYAGMNPNTRSWFGYDANTGTQLWTSDAADYPWGTYGLSGVIAYGKLYALSFDGHVHAYDLNTGHEVFSYYSGDDLFRETPYGTFPFYYGPIIADGVVFAGNGEHSPTQPLYRGYQLHAFDAENGTAVWTLPGWHVIQAIADGYLVSYNAEDNNMYVFGKGPSAMTVNAPAVGVTTATPITISGTVIDISGGTRQEAKAANFPNGVPCVSDASQSAWMEYVYMQQPCPESVTGVPVDISVLDSNGNYRSIGSTTSDGSGTFALTWTPDISGDYTVVASFAGSESYYPSNAETHFTASDTAPTPAPTQAPTQSAADMYFVPAVAGIIVSIIIGFTLLALLLLKKRP
jgi:hypothetical protein